MYTEFSNNLDIELNQEQAYLSFPNYKDFYDINEPIPDLYFENQLNPLQNSQKEKRETLDTSKIGPSSEANDTNEESKNEKKTDSIKGNLIDHLLDRRNKICYPDWRDTDSNQEIIPHDVSKQDLIRLKRQRTKQLLEKTRPGVKRFYLENNDVPYISIKEKKLKSGRKIIQAEEENNNDKQDKVLKNRESAQKSREKKKEEKKRIEAERKDLINKVDFLEKENKTKDQEIARLKSVLARMCPQCISLQGTPSQADFTINMTGGYKKAALFGGMFVVLCIVGALLDVFSFTEGNVASKNQSTRPRQLFINQKPYCKNNSTEVETSSGEIIEILMQNFSEYVEKKRASNYNISEISRLRFNFKKVFAGKFFSSTYNRTFYHDTFISHNETQHSTNRTSNLRRGEEVCKKKSPLQEGAFTESTKYDDIDFYMVKHKFDGGELSVVFVDKSEIKILQANLEMMRKNKENIAQDDLTELKLLDRKAKMYKERSH